VDQLWQRLADLFSPERIGAYLVDDLLPDVIVAVVYFLVVYVAYRIARRTAGAVMGRLGLDDTVRSFVQTILKAVVLTIGVVAALGELGVNTMSLVTSLGVAGLTIGFAARDVLSNIISGLFIFWDRPFTVNDLVEIDGHYGRVKEITLRSTRVVTPDGKMLAIPNTQIVNSTVASYTNFPHLRLDVDIAIALREDIDRARRILVELVRDDRRFLDTPPPATVVTALNDYNVQLQLRAWLDDEREHIEARLELRERMFRAFTEAGIVMPYETLELAPLTVEQGGRAA